MGHLFSPGGLQAAHPLATPHISIYYLDVTRFDWDQRKNSGNRSEHGG